MAFATDGRRAVTGGGNTFEKGDGPGASLRLWDLATGKQVRQFEGHTKDVRRVAISPASSRHSSSSATTVFPRVAFTGRPRWMWRSLRISRSINCR